MQQQEWRSKQTCVVGHLLLVMSDTVCASSSVASLQTWFAFEAAQVGACFIPWVPYCAKDCQFAGCVRHVGVQCCALYCDYFMRVLCAVNDCSAISRLLPQFGWLADMLGRVLQPVHVPAFLTLSPKTGCSHVMPCEPVQVCCHCCMTMSALSGAGASQRPCVSTVADSRCNTTVYSGRRQVHNPLGLLLHRAVTVQHSDEHSGVNALTQAALCSGLSTQQGPPQRTDRSTTDSSHSAPLRTLPKW